jgi:hypothetical protein
MRHQELQFSAIMLHQRLEWESRSSAASAATDFRPVNSKPGARFRALEPPEALLLHIGGNTFSQCPLLKDILLFKGRDVE